MNIPYTTPARPSLIKILGAMGFRPFYLLAAIWSVLAMALWLAILSGMIEIELFWNPFWWHGHEMLFGFVGAAAAGFMLTAAPIWSASPALSGRPLLMIVLAWLVGRIAVLFSPFLPVLFIALADLSFWVLFLKASAPTLWNTGNRVHRIFPSLLALVFIGNILMHLESLGWSQQTAHRGLYLGIDAIIFFLVVVGGHIMPMFTRETLNTGEQNLQFPLIPAFEIAGVVTMVAVLIGDLVDYQHPLTGYLYLSAAIVQTLRFSRWHVLKTFGNPMLWSLHVGFSWLILGLFLAGISRLTDWLDIVVALHALTVGAMGFFILGIMSRISLIHTGQSVVAGRRLTAAFFVLLLSACLRLFPDLPLPIGAVFVSALLWMVSFSLFLWVFWGRLTKPRVDGEPG
ncbi:MAG: NnrS family protein [Magnetococcales bacterium]|nr:NnrS family protein [Magnetococcales bacterium]